MANVEEQARHRNFVDVPLEILQIIASYLSHERDIYYLIQTCKVFYDSLIKQLYEYDANNSRKSMAWAFEKQRLDTVRRAIGFGIDMFEFSHVQQAVAINDWDIIQTVLRSPGVKPAWEPRDGQHRQSTGEPLIYAVPNGNINVARLLISHGANPFRKYTIWDFPSFPEIAQQYLKCAMKEGPVSRTSRQPISALGQAARLGRWHMVRLFISYAESTYVTMFSQGLEIAARYGQRDILKLFLDAGCNANRSDFELRSLLHLTSLSGCTETFQLLLDHGAILDYRKSRNGFTLLHVAGSADMVRLLLEKGFPVDILSDDSRNTPCTPFNMACERDEEAVCIALLDAGAFPHAITSKKLSAMDCAVLSGHVGLVKRLAEMGVSIQEGTGAYPETPLYRAIQKQNLGVIRDFLKLGADMYAMVNDKRPIDEAAFASHEALALLVEYGADLDLRRPDGDATVHFLIRSVDKKMAVKWDACDVLKRLAHFGADMNARNQKGDYPIHIIARLKDWRVATNLVTLGFHVNCRDESGWTALMIACQLQRCGLVSSLFWHGADPHCRVGDAPDGQTALDIVLSCNKFQSLIVKQLMEAGVTVDLNKDSYSKRTRRVLNSSIADYERRNDKAAASLTVQ